MIFYQLLPTTSLGNEHWQQKRIQILILGSKGLKQDFFYKGLALVLLRVFGT